MENKFMTWMTTVSFFFPHTQRTWFYSFFHFNKNPLNSKQIKGYTWFFYWFFFFFGHKNLSFFFKKSTKRINTLEQNKRLKKPWHICIVLNWFLGAGWVKQLSMDRIWVMIATYDEDITSSTYYMLLSMCVKGYEKSLYYWMAEHKRCISSGAHK